MTLEPITCSLRDCESADWYRDPEDHRSSHDAWIQSITVSEPASGDRQQFRKLEMQIRLLGAYHDCIIEYIYTDVKSYSIEGMQPGGHGDWMQDTVTVTKHDTLIHKVMLQSGDFKIEAAEIGYRLTPLPSQAG